MDHDHTLQTETIITSATAPLYRRRVLHGLGGLALGALGLVGITQAAQAKSCQQRCD